MHARQALEKLEKQRDAKKFIERFVQEQEAYRREMEAQRRLEDEKIAAYAQLKLQREGDVELRKKEAEQGRNEVYDIVCFSMPN